MKKRIMKFVLYKVLEVLGVLCAYSILTLSGWAFVHFVLGSMPLLGEMWAKESYWDLFFLCPFISVLTFFGLFLFGAFFWGWITWNWDKAGN